MNIVKREKWLVWAVIILAVMNISTWVTLLYQHYKAEDFPYAPSQSVNESVNLNGRFFRQQLNWDDKQMEQFRQIHPSFRKEVRYIFASLNSYRSAMFNEMISSTCDTTRLNALSDSIGYLHSRLKKITYRYFLELKNICTPDQQKQLEQIFSRILVDDTHVGMGGRYRHRQQQDMNQPKNQINVK